VYETQRPAVDRCRASRRAFFGFRMIPQRSDEIPFPHSFTGSVSPAATNGLKQAGREEARRYVGVDPTGAVRATGHPTTYGLRPRRLVDAG